MTDSAQITEAIQCQGCGAAGTAVWEEVREDQSEISKRVLVGVSDGFYQRVALNPLGNASIVCMKCQQIHSVLPHNYV